MKEIERGKVIYISGKITGVKNYREHFQHARIRLEMRGIFAIDPVKIGDKLERTLGRTPTYAEYLIDDIKYLLTCDGVYMLKGWRRSKGARLERAIAKLCGLSIYYEGATE